MVFVRLELVSISGSRDFRSLMSPLTTTTRALQVFSESICRGCLVRVVISPELVARSWRFTG